MAIHSKLVGLRMRELLKHPVSETFLHLKWTRIRGMFYLNLLQYILMSICLTVLAFHSTNIIKSKIDPSDILK